MSNPLDPLVETLRAAEPRREALDAALRALARPRPPRLVPLAAAVAAFSVFALWPKGSSGYAWAQVADQNLPTRYHKVQTVIAGGRSRTLMEEWVDREADSRRSRDWIFHDFKVKDKSVVSNSLDREFETIETPRGFYGNQISYEKHVEFATYTRRPKVKSKYDSRLSGNVRDRTGLESLLGDKALHQLGVARNVETRVGRADRYELDCPAYTWDAAHRRYRETGRGRFTVYVQSGIKRILGMDTPEPSGDVYQTTFEYPDHFPPETFVFPPKGVKAYDLDALNAKVQERLKTPIVTLRSGGQTAILRIVAQDDHNDLWILWSGGRPNGDLKDRVKVLGVPNGAAHSSLGLVSKGFNGRFSAFGGHSVQLSRSLDRVDLRIPVFAPGKGRSRFVGYATARNVSVLHLPFVEGLEAIDQPSSTSGTAALPRA